ncbi:MAG TPA: L-rhamnose catabolism isomerase [Caulobacteraceae bacterium]
MDEAVISRELIERDNAGRLDALSDDYESLGRSLDRRGVSIDKVKAALKDFAVAIPSWGVGVGGTRFAKFPIAGEPTNIFEKLEDCAVVQALGRNTPTVSTHFPWDRVDDVQALKEKAAAVGVGFDAVNSNTFQDQPGQLLSYKYGSLTHADAAVRDQAVQHNIDCIEIGEALGAEAITVWIADGSNFAGQSDLTGALDRYLDSMARIYAALPRHWRLFIEHKLYEPAFYSTVVSDWGTSLLCAQTLGDKAQCLVDLGHHAPNVNIEQIVARLARFGKLGGFHFNDSKYGDDDLDAGSINPHQLFLVFNELVEAQRRDPEGFRPAYMLDQSHNVTDPIESLLNSAGAVAAAHARALVVDRAALTEHQKANDVIMGFNTLRRAYDTDVTPILAMARYELGGAIDPIAAYRASEWRVRKAQIRKPIAVGQAGIV